MPYGRGGDPIFLTESLPYSFNLRRTYYQSGFTAMVSVVFQEPASNVRLAKPGRVCYEDPIPAFQYPFSCLVACDLKLGEFYSRPRFAEFLAFQVLFVKFPKRFCINPKR